MAAKPCAGGKPGRALPRRRGKGGERPRGVRRRRVALLGARRAHWRLVGIGGIVALHGQVRQRLPSGSARAAVSRSPNVTNPLSSLRAARKTPGTLWVNTVIMAWSTHGCWRRRARTARCVISSARRRRRILQDGLSVAAFGVQATTANSQLTQVVHGSRRSASPAFHGRCA